MLTPTTGGVKFFQHTQSTPAVTWNVFHGFGSKPMVDVNVLDGGVVKKAFPLSIVHVDNDNVQITWSAARTGIVSLASTIE
jgi:hypothetical protein